MSVLYRVPLHVVARWPAWELDLLAQYLAKQPPAEERMELMLAQFMAFYFNAHKGKGAKEMSGEDFLLFRDAWPGSMSQSEYEQTLRDLQ